MKITVRDAGKVRIVDLKGKLVIGDALMGLREAVQGLLAQGHTRIVLNLKGVDYIDSCGLGELVACRNRVKKQEGEIKIAEPTKVAYDSIVAVDLHRSFAVHDEEAKAIGSF